MLLVFLLKNYFALNYSVPPFVTHDAITNGFLNIKVDKKIMYLSNIFKHLNG